MAFSRFHNITGSTGVDVQLLAAGDGASSVKSIMLTNIHATADATVTLFIQDDPLSGTTSTYNEEKKRDKSYHECFYSQS